MKISIRSDDQRSEILTIGDETTLEELREQISRALILPDGSGEHLPRLQVYNRCHLAVVRYLQAAVSSCYFPTIRERRARSKKSRYVLDFCVWCEHRLLLITSQKLLVAVFPPRRAFSSSWKDRLTLQLVTLRYFRAMTTHIFRPLVSRIKGNRALV